MTAEMQAVIEAATKVLDEAAFRQNYGLTGAQRSLAAALDAEAKARAVVPVVKWSDFTAGLLHEGEPAFSTAHANGFHLHADEHGYWRTETGGYIKGATLDEAKLAAERAAGVRHE